MSEDPLFAKPSSELTHSEREVLKLRYNLPDHATPEPILAKARVRSAKRRSLLRAVDAPLDQRPIAAAAFRVILERDARNRATGKQELDPLFAEIAELVPKRYDRTVVRAMIQRCRDDALEFCETGRRTARRP